jgi:adenine specific DNA methylase Mod
MRENIIDDEAIELQFPLNTVGTKELKELLQGNIFSYPKSSLLAKAFLRQCTKDNDLILDFFA